MASLFKRKNSPNYYISWYNPSTKRAGMPVSTGTADRREAMRRLRDFESRLNNTVLLKEKQFTFSNALAYYYKNKPELAKQSIKVIRVAVAHLINAVGDLYLNDFDVAEQLKLQLYFSEQNLTVASKNIYLRTLKGFFNFFVESGQVSRNYIKLLKEPKKKVRIIPPDDLTIILNAMKPDQRFLFEFLLHTGLRVGEAVVLKRSNIDLDNKIINYYNFKAHKDGIKPIIEPLYNLLASRKLNEQMFVYHNYNSVHLYWKRLINNLNKKPEYKSIGKTFDYTIHQLRKTCTSYLMNLGVNPFAVQEYIGHSDLQVTKDFYTLADYEKIRREIDKKIKEDKANNNTIDYTI